jgi:hypothetical protein
MVNDAPWQLSDGNAVVAEWVNWRNRRVITSGYVREVVDGGVVIAESVEGPGKMIDITRLSEVAVMTEGVDGKTKRREALAAMKAAADLLKAREFDPKAFTESLSGIIETFRVN